MTGEPVKPSAAAGIQEQLDARLAAVDGKVALTIVRLFLCIGQSHRFSPPWATPMVAAQLSKAQHRHQTGSANPNRKNPGGEQKGGRKNCRSRSLRPDRHLRADAGAAGLGTPRASL